MSENNPKVVTQKEIQSAIFNIVDVEGPHSARELLYKLRIRLQYNLQEKMFWKCLKKSCENGLILCEITGFNYEAMVEINYDEELSRILQPLLFLLKKKQGSQEAIPEEGDLLERFLFLEKQRQGNQRLIPEQINILERLLFLAKHEQGIPIEQPIPEKVNK